MEPEWLTAARKNGLLGKTVGVNLAALAPSETRCVASSAGTAAGAWADEKEFQRAVVDLALSLGWKVAHCRKVLVRMGERQHYETPMAVGWPDLTLVRDGRLVFAELKFGSNTTTAEQKDWLRELGATGAECYVWYPKHWDDIVRVLAAAATE